jgi:hypothetical protein
MKQAVFAIRDDDTSFFSQPAELEAVYAPYWDRVPVSLAVVPFSVPAHRERSFNTAYPPEMEMALDGNTELLKWLKEKIHARQIEIMLHGYSHQYVKINGRWKGEYGWKTKERLEAETAKGKEYLETLLGVPIRVFVPPGNTLSKAGICAIRKSGLNVSGIMGRGGDRPLTRDYPWAYLRRWAWRIAKGTAYPWPLCYGGHTELRAYALTPPVKREDLLRSLEDCATRQAPFVLATHYWEFQKCPEMHKTLHALVERAERMKMRFGFVSECFSPYHIHP